MRNNFSVQPPLISGSFNPSLPYDDASEAGARDGEESEGGADGRHYRESDEPEPLDEEDFVVDDVEAEDAHGVIDVKVARQRARGKLAPVGMKAVEMTFIFHLFCIHGMKRFSLTMLRWEKANTLGWP